MKKLSIVHYFNHLKRQKGVIFLNIAGLSFGLASVIFISLWIRHETSFDSFHKNADRIYRVESLLDFTGSRLSGQSFQALYPRPSSQIFRR
ncbi:MAG: ABC transporter permease [Bacteroidales bacterium]